MGSVRGLYERFRHLIHEGAKFLVIGAIGTVVTFGAANALQGIGRYKAVTIATILATCVTYLGNRYWTFRHRQSNGTTRDSIAFFVLNGIGLLIYYGCIGLTDLAGLGSSKIWYNVALIVGTGFGTMFRFWSYRKWVWTSKSGGSAQDVPVRAGPGHGGPSHGGPSHGGPGNGGPFRIGPIGMRPHGRHAGNGKLGPVQQESLPDAEVSETSAWPR
ncbi:MAG TPA: GtrA family protein [Streptosporangiaceae bacterium]